jgi:phosphoserine phosphatase
MPRSTPGTTRLLLLVRHGLTAWNAEQRWQGSRDLELCEEGRGQAAALRPRLAAAGLQAAFCSDLARARETARIASPEPIVPLEDPALREMSYGAWEGVTDEEVHRAWPEERRRWLEEPHAVRPGGGESLDEVGARAWAGLLRCLERTTGNLVVVAHGGVNRVLLGRILGIPPARFWALQQSPTGVNVVELPRTGSPEDALGRARVLVLNCTRHLGAHGA